MLSTNESIVQYTISFISYYVLNVSLPHSLQLSAQNSLTFVFRSSFDKNFAQFLDCFEDPIADFNVKLHFFLSLEQPVSSFLHFLLFWNFKGRASSHEPVCTWSRVSSSSVISKDHLQILHIHFIKKHKKHSLKL